MTITILTPTLNAERWIFSCARSIRDQHLPPDRIQHLVLDGSSTDATQRLAQEAGCEVVAAPDRSLYQALNRGIRLARGDVIGWLNADDTFAPGALEAVVRSFKGNADLVIGHYALERDNRIRIRRTPSEPFARMRAGATSPVWVIPLAVFFRADVLRSLGNYLECYRVAADLDFWLRAAAREPQLRVVHTGTVIGTFRIHDASLSTGADPERSLQETIEITRRWSEDQAVSPGLRRYALFLMRQHAFMLCRWEKRAAPLNCRTAAALRCWRELRRLGPGALWDIRGQAAKLASDLAAAAVGRPRRFT